MGRLLPEPHVPGVLVAEVVGDQGRAVVCVPDDAAEVLLMVERDRLSLHLTLAPGEARELAEMLQEAVGIKSGDPG